WFAAVGAASTLFHLLLYTVLRPWTGAQAANALALLAGTLANTAANRRLTVGVRGRGGVLRHHLKSLAAFLVGLALTSGSLALLHRAAPGAAPGAELLTLVLAGLAATLLRFLLLRAWVFPGSRSPSRRTTGTPRPCAPPPAGPARPPPPAPPPPSRPPPPLRPAHRRPRAPARPARVARAAAPTGRRARPGARHVRRAEAGRVRRVHVPAGRGRGLPRQAPAVRWRRAPLGRPRQLGRLVVPADRPARLRPRSGARPRRHRPDHPGGQLGGVLPAVPGPDADGLGGDRARPVRLRHGRRGRRLLRRGPRDPRRDGAAGRSPGRAGRGGAVGGVARVGRAVGGVL